MAEQPTSTDLVSHLRRVLVHLARLEEEAAANEAACVHYWQPCPASVDAHRVTAALLRSEADQLLGSIGFALPWASGRQDRGELQSSITLSESNMVA